MTEAARKYQTAVQRAAALQFLAETFDDSDPDVASRLRKGIDKVMTPDAMGAGGEAYVARGDADDVPPGYARSFDGALYKLPSETELESLAHSSGLEAKFYPTGEKARDQRRQELERLGRLPNFGSAALEPGYQPMIDHADEDDTAERAARAREQAELETFLHGLHQ